MWYALVFQCISTGTLHLVVHGAVRGLLRFALSFTNFAALLELESSPLLMTFFRRVSGRFGDIRCGRGLAHISKLYRSPCRLRFWTPGVPDLG